MFWRLGYRQPCLTRHASKFKIMYGTSQVALVVKNLPANAGDIRDASSIPGLGRDWEEIPGLGRRAWQPTPVFLPGESLGQKSLAGYSPWGRKSQT